MHYPNGREVRVGDHVLARPGGRVFAGVVSEIYPIVVDNPLRIVFAGVGELDCCNASPKCCIHADDAWNEIKD